MVTFQSARSLNKGRIKSERVEPWLLGIDHCFVIWREEKPPPVMVEKVRPTKKSINQ